MGEQRNIAKISKGTKNTSPFFGNRGTKLYKIEDENTVNKFIKMGTYYENVWKYWNIGQFWKTTRGNKDPPGRP